MTKRSLLVVGLCCGFLIGSSAWAQEAPAQGAPEAPPAQGAPEAPKDAAPESPPADEAPKPPAADAPPPSPPSDPAPAEESPGQASPDAAAPDGEAPAEPPPITKLPKAVSLQEGEFPQKAIDDGIEQTEVVLTIDIDAQGQVEGVGVQTPSPHPGYGFEDAAVAAAYGFMFEPAMAGETPVPVRVVYTFKFFMKPAVPEEPAPGEAEQEPPPPDPVVNMQGEMVVRGTRAPIPGIVITLFRGDPKNPDAAYEATTDKDGKFQFYDLEPGVWNVLAESKGFFPYRTSEKIVEGKLTDVKYYMEKGGYDGYVQIVEGVRERKEVNRTSLQVAEIEKIPGTAGDILQVVQNLPGVARPPFPGLIIVRGSAPEDTQTVLEGMTIPLIYHFGGIRSVIPNPMLKGIDFYPGNFSAQYGRATGGIVDVRLKKLQPERPGGQIDISILDSLLYLETPLGDNAALAISGRRSYLDFLIDAVASQQDDVNVIAAPRYYDAQLNLQYRPAPGHDLRLFGLLSDDLLRLLFSNPGDGTTQLEGNDFNNTTSFYRGIADYVYTPSENFSNTLRVSYGLDQTKVNFGQFFFELDQTVLQVRDTVSIGLGDSVRWNVGIDEQYTVASFDVFLPPPPKEGQNSPDGGDGPPDLTNVLSTTVEDQSRHSLGLFTEVEIKLFEDLLLIPGVRYDWFSLVDAHRVSPRFTGRYVATEQWVVKGGVGLFYQEPQPDETDVTFGNPDLGPEGAVHYSAGFEYRPLDYLTLDVTGFYKTLFDLVSPPASRDVGTPFDLVGLAQSPAATDLDVEAILGDLASDGIPGQQLTNTGIGRVYGAEILLRHDLANNFTGWLSYTLMRSERRDRQGAEWRLFDFDQTHILTLLGTYRLPRNWEVGLRWRLVSGNPTTLALGSKQRTNEDDFQPVNGPTNADRVPAFHQLDVRVDKTWIYNSWKFGVYLDVQNIYNRENPQAISYNFNYLLSEYSQTLPILPILGLRGEY